MGKRYFEFLGEDTQRHIANSAKFWEIWLDDTTLNVRFGKIGSKGQTTIKKFGTVSDAEKALEKAVDEKVKKGYSEQTQGVQASIDSTTPATASKATVKFCEECGTKRDPITAKFCGNCGSQFN